MTEAVPPIVHAEGSTSDPKLPGEAGLPDIAHHGRAGPAQGSADTAEALRAVVREVEAHVSAAGWDLPAHLFALVPTRELTAAEPQLAADLGILDGNASLLTPVQQELDGHAAPMEDLLARISWPAAVRGAVAVVERVVLPPGAEVDVPDDAAAAADFAANHEQRQDVRIAVGVLRGGVSHCVVRMRAHDSDEALLQGPEVVPALVSAVRETLEADAVGAEGVPVTLEETGERDL